jgi:hypothetical protein
MARAKRRGLLDGIRKSEVVTVRLDPRLKYLAELAARRQRRPLSSYIEWAIEESLAQVHPAADPNRQHEPETFKDVAGDLWDVDEPDRFARLAIRYPDLLDHEEQRLWKLIRECGYLWKGAYRGSAHEWQWTVGENSLIWERLREHWDAFYQIAKGQADPSILPSWPKHDPSTKGGVDLDDEIPF